MWSSASSPWRLLRTGALASLVGGLLVTGCIELNPYFDPDAGLACSPGERRCAENDIEVEICTQDATGFAPLRRCFEESHCVQQYCVPDEPATPCTQEAECTDPGEICTVLVTPSTTPRLGTFCIPAPHPTGRMGGQACASHDQCRSGYCFRSLCYEACGTQTHCTNDQHQCQALDITVDGIRDSQSIRGCGP